MSGDLILEKMFRYTNNEIVFGMHYFYFVKFFVRFVGLQNNTHLLALGPHITVVLTISWIGSVTVELDTVSKNEGQGEGKHEREKEAVIYGAPEIEGEQVDEQVGVGLEIIYCLIIYLYNILVSFEQVLMNLFGYMAVQVYQHLLV